MALGGYQEQSPPGEQYRYGQMAGNAGSRDPTTEALALSPAGIGAAASRGATAYAAHTLSPVGCVVPARNEWTTRCPARHRARATGPPTVLASETIERGPTSQRVAQVGQSMANMARSLAPTML